MAALDSKKGYLEGRLRMYDSKDQPLVIGQYAFGKRTGLWTYYYYDQEVIIESNFIIDTKSDEKYLTIDHKPFSGEFIFYDDENGIKEIRKISKGLRNGKTVYKDIKTNETIRKETYKDGQLKE